MISTILDVRALNLQTFVRYEECVWTCETSTSSFLERECTIRELLPEGFKTKAYAGEHFSKCKVVSSCPTSKNTVVPGDRVNAEKSVANLSRPRYIMFTYMIGASPHCMLVVKYTMNKNWGLSSF